jgi:hypothetical protein
MYCVVVRWLSFKNTPLGDMGMRVLSPHIGRMQIQVLVLERCGLSDESCPSISSIIKVIINTVHVFYSEHFWQQYFFL